MAFQKIKKLNTNETEIEDIMELSEQTKKDLMQSRKDIKEGRVYTLEEVKKRLGLK